MGVYRQIRWLIWALIVSGLVWLLWNSSVALVVAGVGTVIWITWIVVDLVKHREMVDACREVTQEPRPESDLHEEEETMVPDLESIDAPVVDNMADPIGEALEEPSLVDQIPGFAEKHREMFRKLFDVDLDYSPESLITMDEIIDAHFEPYQKPTIDTTILMFGAYFGETIRRQLGGVWKDKGDDGVALEDVGGSVTVFPFSKVTKRFENGIEDSLSYFFITLRSLVEAHPGKAETIES